MFENWRPRVEVVVPFRIFLEAFGSIWGRLEEKGLVTSSLLDSMIIPGLVPESDISELG